MVVLLDTNILLDVLQKREGLYETSFSVMEKCAQGNCSGYIAPHSVANIFFILKKAGVDTAKIRLLLSGILKIVDVSIIDKEDLLSAIDRDDFADFEDCLQDECASNVGADYIITRNIKDFHSSVVKAITPEEFLELQQ